MSYFRRHYSSLWSYALILSVSAFTTSCFAMSRMPPAQVIDSNGIPCFAVTDEAGTHQGKIQLFGLSVTEGKSTNWQTLPKEKWAFIIEPQGNSIETSPQNCIRYGEAPVTAKVRQDALPLQPYHLYVVFIEARPIDGAVAQLGYGAEFCVKPTSDGKVMVQMVPWDLTKKRWRYEVCTSPQKEVHPSLK